jgi:hypothetical protein
MTRDEILNMPAGREMDKLIAIEIFKLPEIELDDANCPYCGEEMWHGQYRARCTNCNEWRYSPYKEYSSEIADAWEVVEKMQGDWWKMEFLTGIHVAEFEKPNMKCEDQTYHEAQADTMPLAICRAALLTTLEDMKDEKKR